MKCVIVVFTLLAASSAVLGLSEYECTNKVIDACRSSTLTGHSICNSRHAGIDEIEPEVQAYINSHFTKSYEYLLMATNFDSYQKHRPGFQKLFQDLSDRSFDDTIDMIKKLSRRGGKANFNIIHESPAAISRSPIDFELDELHSLALALDTEKQLYAAVTHVHTHALHAFDRNPEMAHYIAESPLGKHAENVHKLNSYVNNLAKLMEQNDPHTAVYIFDQYLIKQ